MTSILEHVIGLSHRQDRVPASHGLARLLGGSRLFLFVRDPEVGVLLPAPGFPQTFRAARDWRKLLDAAVVAGECAQSAITPPEGGDGQPVLAIAGSADVVAAVLGASQRSPHVDTLQPLLPLLGSVIRCERMAQQATAREQAARQSAAHAEALAVAFDQSRIELQRALAAAEESRLELQLSNAHLAEQASELELQAEELAAQAEELTLQSEQLHATNLKLESARAAAESANKAKSQFLATMSHELRTPLNAIGGHVQLIELGIYGAITNEQRTALERIDRSQRHLLGLINDVLNLARIEAGRVEYRLEELSISAILADLGPMVEPQYRAKSLRYGVSCDAGLTATADREKLEQILINLLSNAIKFTPSGGVIEIAGTTSDDASHVLIRVTDTGIGIAADKQSSVFEPFVQINATHSRTSEGTGLGLAISRDLARGMGGDLMLDSAPDRGSTFTLSIPACRARD